MSRHEEAGPESVVDGRYVVRREIARGGMACVFEAEHLVTRAKVALKTLTHAALGKPAAHARALREARALGAICHPMVVAIHDAGTCTRHGPFLALEMISGRPLDGILLAKQRLSVGQAVAVATELCDALDEVNRRGIVHRDVKPANVLIGRTPVGDQVELIDFGVALVAGEADIPDASKLTKEGELLGTVEYMSPEQITGRGTVDGRSDVYGAGVVLFECLTGEVPFSGSPTAIISSIVMGSPPPPIRERRADVPAALEEVVRRALAIDLEKRFRTNYELAAALRSAMNGSVPRLDLLDVRDARASDRALPGPDAAPAAGAAPDAFPRRRQFARAPYVTPLRLVLPDGRICDGRSEDISEGGVLMVTDTECARDATVEVRLPLPGSGRVVVLRAITKWIKTRRNQRAVGLELKDAPDDVRAEIRVYVAAMTGAPGET